MYGHAYGDKALISLAAIMRKFFPSSALLGRNGGDEFCILLPNCTAKEAKEPLIEFTKTPKTFIYKGQTYSFCMLQHPVDQKDLPQANILKDHKPFQRNIPFYRNYMRQAQVQ